MKQKALWMQAREMNCRSPFTAFHCTDAGVMKMTMETNLLSQIPRKATLKAASSGVWPGGAITTQHSLSARFFRTKS